MKIKADIDIDVIDRNKVLSFLPHIPASISDTGNGSRHPSGVYFQDIPTNPLTGRASFDYRKAEELGYFKVDFINNSIYQNVTSDEHLIALMNTEPMWDLLGDADFVGMLAHVHNHFDIVNTIKPRSIHDLAVVIALIRPGKRHLLTSPRSKIDAEIWLPTTDGSYYFKKSHSYSYAMSIMVQMNLIVESV